MQKRKGILTLLQASGTILDNRYSTTLKCYAIFTIKYNTSELFV